MKPTKHQTDRHGKLNGSEPLAPQPTSTPGPVIDPDLVVPLGDGFETPTPADTPKKKR